MIYTNADRDLDELVETILMQLPSDLRKEAVHKGFMIKPTTVKGELQFEVTIPGASKKLRDHLSQTLSKTSGY